MTRLSAIFYCLFVFWEISPEDKNKEPRIDLNWEIHLKDKYRLYTFIPV